MQFPGVLANDDVCLDVLPGEVFALVGENGAGKSTLMNILYGLHEATSGQLYVKGRQVPAGYDPAMAIRMGVGMVHQHFMLVPSFSVSQNIALGIEPRKRGAFYDFARADADVRALSGEFGLHVEPQARVSELSVGLQQRVEILKTLHRGADILILDEPTAVLTPGETDELFHVLRRIVREKGMTVIIITHKLYEVTQISDRVGVMRQGKLVGVKDTKDIDERMLASMMVGREVLHGELPRTGETGGAAIEVENLQALSDRMLPAVNGLSFTVHRGEILGVAAVEGNGQSELLEAITGMRPMRGGFVRVLGRDVRGLSPGQIRALGLAHIPEDRLLTGVSKAASIQDNLLAGKQRSRAFSALGIQMKWGAARRYAQSLLKKFDIRAAGIETQAQSLSGGNMQKVVLAREFSFDAQALIIAQPTRGVDIGAIEFIHQSIIDKRNRGCAILLVSADLDEVMRLSDRIITIYEGQITGEFLPRHTTPAEVGYHMTGDRRADA